MECPSIQISWLDVKVLEGMRRRVNLLVDEFHLHFIRGHRRPPEQPVHPVGSWFQNPLRNVDVMAVLDDFAVNQLRDLLG